MKMLKLSENIIELLQQTPSGRDVLTKIRAGAPIKTLMANSFCLHHLLDSSQGNYESNCANLIALLFHQGVITFDVNGENFVIPNEISRYHLLGQLPTPNLTLYDIEQAIINPSAISLHQVIEQILVVPNGVATLCDNNLFEAGMHSTIASAFAVLCYKEGELKNEEKIQIINDPLGHQKNGYYNLLMTCNNQGLLLEFKRIRPQEIINFGVPKIDQKKRNEVCFVAEDIAKFLNSKTDQDIKKMEIEYDGTVEEILKKATTQVLQYANGVKEKHHLTSIRSFVVLSLATRLIIVDADKQ